MKPKLEKLFVRKNDKIIDVINSINENALKSAFIVGKDNILLGVVTDGDIRRAILRDIPLTDPIEKIMIKNPLVAKLGVPESEILNLLITKNILIIPILDDKRRIVKYYHIFDFIKEEYLKNNVKEVLNSRKSKKILVTGGAGYIGSCFVRILLNHKYSVRVLDKLLFGIDSISDLLSNPDFEFVEGDYTKIEDLIPCLKDVHAIVHLAAIVGDPAGNIDPELTEEINFHGVKILSEFCKYYGIERFIFVSTCSVYGASDDNFLTENSKLNPLSLYAETKLKAENALLKLNSDNFHICILRLATVFGWSYRMRFDLVVNLLTALAIKNKKISIYSGKQWRPFVHVKDVGDAILNILNQPIEKISGQIFNIGKDENNFQIEAIGNLMKKIFPEIEVERIEQKEDNRSYKVSFKKAKTTLDYMPKYNLEDGIREIAQNMKNVDVNFKESQYSNYKKVQCGLFDSISFAE